MHGGRHVPRAMLTRNRVLGVAAVLELDEGEPHPHINFLQKRQDQKNKPQQLQQ